MSHVVTLGLKKLRGGWIGVAHKHSHAHIRKRDMHTHTFHCIGRDASLVLLLLAAAAREKRCVSENSISNLVFVPCEFENQYYFGSGLHAAKQEDDWHTILRWTKNS